MTSQRSLESPQRLSQSPPGPNHYDVSQDGPQSTGDGATLSGPNNGNSTIDERSPPRAIFVGNFAHFARTTDIEQLFSAFGPVQRVDLKRNFAFVFMSSEQNGRDAIIGLDGKSDSEIAPRPLKVEWARGDGAIKRREDERRRQAQTPSDTLFVVNFEPRSTTRQGLHDRFSSFGRVTRLDMQQRFAFVQFESVEQATAALKALHGSRIEGRHLIVEYTVRSTPPMRRGPPTHRVPYGGAYGGAYSGAYGGGYVGGPPPHPFPSSYHHHSYPDPSSMRPPHSPYRYSRPHFDHQPSPSRYRPRHAYASATGSSPRRGPEPYESSYSRRRSASPIPRPRRESSPDRFRQRDGTRVERGRDADHDQNADHDRTREGDHRVERERDNMHSDENSHGVDHDGSRNDLQSRNDPRQQNDFRNRNSPRDPSASPHRSAHFPEADERDGHLRQGTLYDDEGMSNGRKRGLHGGDMQEDEGPSDNGTRRFRRQSYSRSPSPHAKRSRYEETNNISPRYEPGGEATLSPEYARL